MKQGAWSLLAVALLSGCGTVEPGPDALSIRAATLPEAVVGLKYEDKKVLLQAERGAGSLSWSLPLLPPSLSWLSIGESSGQLMGVPLDVVSPAATFLVQVNSGTASAQRQFTLSVGCREGALSPCGVPDAAAARCVAGSRVCLNGRLGACTAEVGRPPYEADANHCGASCDETCSRTSSNRCVGTCTCGSATGPCSGATPACCPGSDGRPEGFACVSLQTPEHCGACQTACQPRPQTKAGCSSSACRFPCVEPYLNCNGGPVTTEGPDADGCETRIDTAENCGACGKRCPPSLPPSAHTAAGAAPACTSSACRYGCDVPRWHNCSDGTCVDFTTDLDADGCETDFSSTSSCGAKNNVCPSIENAVPTCTLNATGRYQCGLKCKPGFDPDPCGSPPVCKPLSDPDNCGACGRSCPTMIGSDGSSQQCNADGECCVKTCDPMQKPPCQTFCVPP